MAGTRGKELPVRDITNHARSCADNDHRVSSEVQDLGGVLYASLSDPDGNGWALQQLPY
jgi:hypothetical protein